MYIVVEIWLRPPAGEMRLEMAAGWLLDGCWMAAGWLDGWMAGGAGGAGGRQIKGGAPPCHADDASVVLFSLLPVSFSISD
jgi:hypothetical protein